MIRSMGDLRGPHRRVSYARGGSFAASVKREIEGTLSKIETSPLRPSADPTA
jgi:hypothetical protein